MRIIRQNQGDNIELAVRRLDNGEGKPDALVAAQHLLGAGVFPLPPEASGGDARADLYRRMAETDLAMRIKWADGAWELVQNGAPIGVLCADLERDEDGRMWLAVWADTLSAAAGSSAQDAVQVVREAAAAAGATLATRSERFVVDYRPL